MDRSYRNVLLTMAGPECLAQITPHLDRVELRRLEIIACPGEKLDFVHFMEDSMISVVSHLDEYRDIQLGLIGREGMTGEAVFLDASLMIKCKTTHDLSICYGLDIGCIPVALSCGELALAKEWDGHLTNYGEGVDVKPRWSFRRSCVTESAFNIDGGVLSGSIAQP